ncbi:MAG: hypothetical protein IJ906_01415 [Oscillospiraceae bacterium]|nr:hypothetical protein [Oscillospiraceae bacterium]
MNKRYCGYKGLIIYDENGKLVMDGEESSVSFRYIPSISSPDGNVETLADGSYTGSVLFSLITARA